MNKNNLILKINDIEFFNFIYKNLFNFSIVNIEYYILYYNIYIFINKFKNFVNFKNENKIREILFIYFYNIILI